VQASTFARYGNYARLYILAEDIAQVRLARVTSDDVQAWYNALADRGLAPGTIAQAVALLRQALGRAHRSGLLATHPMVDSDAPKRPGRRRFRVPSDDELRALLELMETAGASVYPITRMALATGMRQGELIALEWSSVDLRAGLVYVCRSAARIPAGPKGATFYRYEFKSTKTDESTDAVPLDGPTVAWLKAWKKTIAEQKLMLRPDRWTDADGDLVFPCLATFAGVPAGRAWKAGSVRKAFDRYTAKAGLGYLHFHDLRHVFGAVLHRHGVDLLTISRLMRHKSIKTTADAYGHVGEETKREAVAELGGLWG
jgi:integrase